MSAVAVPIYRHSQKFLTFWLKQVFFQRSLAKIFNILVKAGVFPADWNLACVVPIFKNGSIKSELGNYRPISLLSAVARVFEHLVYEQLSEYFQENNFFTKY